MRLLASREEKQEAGGQKAWPKGDQFTQLTENLCIFVAVSVFTFNNSPQANNSWMTEPSILLSETKATTECALVY